MIVGYDIGGGGHRLFDGEHLRVEDDGDYELWRLTESPLVGRFAGRLAEADRAALAELARRAAAAAGDAVTPDAPLPPGAHGERWLAGQASLLVAGGRAPDGAWGSLVAATRDLLPTLLEQPVAAVELVVDEGWGSATLRHRGGEPLRLDPGYLAVEVAAWKGYYDLVGTWNAAPGDLPQLGRGAGGPGWTLEIKLRHGFRPGGGRVLHVKVGVEAVVDGGRSRLVATVAPQMRDPGA